MNMLARSSADGPPPLEGCSPASSLMARIELDAY